jgi:hypothetical protein
MMGVCRTTTNSKVSSVNKNLGGRSSATPYFNRRDCKERKAHKESPSDFRIPALVSNVALAKVDDSFF